MLRTGINQLMNYVMDKKGKINGLLKKTEKQKEVKVGGQSKIEINPKADIGQYSGEIKSILKLTLGRISSERL